MRINAACRREHAWLVKHGLRTGAYVVKKLIGCGLHVLNLCDVGASDAWRGVDETAGDPYAADDLIIGGKDKKESWTYFVCRFFSRAMRWNVAWRSWLAVEKGDYEDCPRALRSRFWSRLKVGEYLFNRFEWFGEWFSGGAKALEKHNKSAVYALLSEMERHRRLLQEDLMVMRVVSLWLHGPLGHSVTTSTSKEHLDQLRATLAEAKAMVGDSDDGGDDAADAREKLFKRYGSEALVQKAEFLAESAAKVAEKNGTAAPGAPDKAARQVTRTAAHDGAVRDAMDAMAGPTTHQHERLRLYAKCTVEKHEKFLDMLLQQRQEQQEEGVNAPLHTFHIERGNAVLKKLHDRNVRSCLRSCSSLVVLLALLATTDALATPGCVRVCMLVRRCTRPQSCTERTAG